MTTIKCDPTSLRERSQGQLDALGRIEASRVHATNCLRELLAGQPNVAHFQAAGAEIGARLRRDVVEGAGDAQFIARFADWMEQNDSELGKTPPKVAPLKLPNGRTVQVQPRPAPWQRNLDPAERGGSHNAEIVAAALAAPAGAYGGQCRVWVNNVVKKKLGIDLSAYRVRDGTAPNEYHMAFEQAGAVSVPPAQALPGDIIQFGEREVYVNGRLQMPLHTAIVVETRVENGKVMLRLAESNAVPPFGERVSQSRWIPATAVVDSLVTGKTRVWRLP